MPMKKRDEIRGCILNNIIFNKINNNININNIISIIIIIYYIIFFIYNNKLKKKKKRKNPISFNYNLLFS